MQDNNTKQAKNILKEIEQVVYELYQYPADDTLTKELATLEEQAIKLGIPERIIKEKEKIGAAMWLADIDTKLGTNLLKRT